MTSTTFWIQFLGVIFGILMFYFSFVKFKRKELREFEFTLWTISWSLLIFIAIIPSLIDFIIEPLNFYRRLDFFVVFGFFILLGLAFYNYSTIKKMERKLELVVRTEALKRRRNADKNKIQ